MTMRERSLIGLVGAMFFLLAVGIGGIYFADAAVATDFTAKNIAPCLAHPFGTDWMGRDMFARTLRGLALSIGLGIVSAAVSAGIALILGIAAAVLGKKVDAVISCAGDPAYPAFDLGHRGIGKRIFRGGCGDRSDALAGADPCYPGGGDPIAGKSVRSGCREIGEK